MDTILNTIDDVKHKLTDAEYKAIMDGLMEVNKAQPSNVDNFLKKCKGIIGEGDPDDPSPAEFAGAISGTGIDARFDEIVFELEMGRDVAFENFTLRTELDRTKTQLEKTKKYISYI